VSVTVEIVTPSAVVFTGTVDQIQAPGVLGEFGVLEQHAAMLAVTTAGTVSLHTADGVQRMVVGPGFAEIGSDQVTLLVDQCEDEGAVDSATAKVDLEEAFVALSKVDAMSDDGVLLQKRIDLAQARIAH
jgi:F-type H+-transporting ATPase subunit epsilon